MAYEGKLYVYAGGIWQALGIADIRGRVLKYHNNALVGKNVVKVSKSTCDAAATLALRICTDHEFFECAKPGAAFVNGFLDVNGELHPHSPDHRCRIGYNFNYASRQEPPHFLTFLNEVFENDPDKEQKILVVRQFMGSCLFGIAGVFEACMILLGSGSNGKSVLLDIIAQLFPREALSTIPPQDMADQFLLSQIQGSLINLHHELPPKKVSDSTQFKAVISGQRVTAREIYGEPFSFKPRCGHIFSCNELPETSDASYAFWRRFLVVRFNKTFSGSKKTHDIVQPILAQRESLICWAADAVPDLWSARHYVHVPSGLEEIDFWKDESDSAMDFVSHCLAKDSSFETNATTLYAAYTRYCTINNVKALPKTRFAQRVRMAGIVKFRKSTGVVYQCRIVDSRLEFVTAAPN